MIDRFLFSFGKKKVIVLFENGEAFVGVTQHFVVVKIFGRGNEELKCF